MFFLNWSSLLVVAAALAVVGVWYESARAREAANRVAVDACRRRSLQFLDGTVALTVLRPRLGRGGLRIERTYVFDYAGEGGARSSGFIIMLGDELRHIGFDSD